MKIITKKSVIFAALAVVLLATALVISCNTPLDVLSDKEEPSKPGTGKVRLSINTRNKTRTILPTAVPGNTKYLLILKGSGISYYVTVTENQTSVSDVPIGNYTSAQVIMYSKDAALDNTDGSTYATYALGASDINNGTFNINSAAPTSLGAAFVPVFYTPGTSSGDGTFTYEITKDAVSRVKGATFVIKGRGINNFPDNTPTPYSVVFGTPDPLTSIKNIPSGYYDVIFTIEDTTPGTSLKSYFYQVLHVYKNMESTLSALFSNDIFPPSPSSGNGSFSITPPDDLEDVECTLEKVDSTGVKSLGINSLGWVVEIGNDATVAELTFTITSPSSGVSIGAWKLLPDLTTISSGSGGITLTPNVMNAQELGIKIDATASSPALDVTGNINTTVLMLALDGVDFNSPNIYIKFVDP